MTIRGTPLPRKFPETPSRVLMARPGRRQTRRRTILLQIRDYQGRIVDHAIKAVEDGHKSILIESPTGSGKSLMAHLVAQRLHEKYGWTAGWTAMRRHLLSQAKADNERLLGFKAIKYFSLFDKNPPTGIDVLIED